MSNLPVTSTAERNPDNSPSWRTTIVGADTEGRAGNASWSAILAGVVVAIAVVIAFSLVAAAFGLGVADPTSDEPFDNVGLAIGSWSVVALVVAMAAGGFVAGALAVRAGFLHGLAVWASATIALVVGVVLAVSGIVGVAGSLLGSVGSAIGSAGGSLADQAGEGVAALVEQVGEFDDLDTSGLSDDVQQVLSDTGIPELQPEYFQSQIDDVRSEVADAAEELVTNPDRFEVVLDALGTSVTERVETIAESVDRDVIADAVAQNSDLSEADAQQATDNAYEAAQDVTDQVRRSINDAQDALDRAQEEIPQLVDDARETLGDATDAASRAAVWAFVGLLIGAAIATFAGLWGSRLVVARTETGRMRSPGERTDTA